MERTLDVLVFRSSCRHWTVLAKVSTSELKNLFPAAGKVVYWQVSLAFFENCLPWRASPHQGCLPPRTPTFSDPSVQEHKGRVLSWRAQGRPGSRAPHGPRASSSMHRSPPCPTAQSSFLLCPYGVSPERTPCKYPAQKSWSKHVPDALSSQIFPKVFEAISFAFGWNC